MTELNADNLPQAVRKLFELNHYEVEGPVRLHGAEFDLVARPISDPFGVPIYIEVTIEYVDNEKYGKDVAKLSIISTQDPSAKKLIISLRGFTSPVIERAKNSGIETLTYVELFKKFERFEPYISFYLGQTSQANDLRDLSQIYEEPDFSDLHGEICATQFLMDWKNSRDNSGQWLVITGEYGTGKTALTKVLLYRWLVEYQTNLEMPLPIRIELRDFVNQFDARGLLHHFLDHNQLSHISLDYFLSLIRSGRIILILDGYDEMAQYLHARERRTCLEALAQLSVDGAKGILTSRPNYFTETEELQMFELLYKSIDHGRYILSSQAKHLLQKEKETDQLLEKFIDRYERNLKDLTPTQTETLIRRILSGDEIGQKIVLRLLNRIFRSFENDADISLSGKPVIVSYLLEVVEGLKDETSDNTDEDTITEWQVYKLIIDQLMLRDFHRSPDIMPQKRRDFLRKVAIFLSQREHPVISEEEFRDFVSKRFTKEIGRYTGIARSDYLERLFADLRTSATLTRGGPGLGYGWRFSHNSLREYLVAEALIVGLDEGYLVSEDVVISDAMRMFARSVETRRLEHFVQLLTKMWSEKERGRGQLLALLWDGFLELYPESLNRREVCLKAITGDPPQVEKSTLKYMQISTERMPTSLENSDFSNSYLSYVDFQGATLNNAKFNGAMLEDVNFEYADLTSSDFRGAFLLNCDFCGSILEDADFSKIEPDDISILVDSHITSKKIIEGVDAIGFLNFNGAKTDDLKPIYIMKHHPKFNIVDKILRKLSMQTIRQRRGLEQRGAAHQDTSLAKNFVMHLESTKIIKPNRKDLIEVTDYGRKVISSYVNDEHLRDEIVSFLK